MNALDMLFLLLCTSAICNAIFYSSGRSPSLMLSAAKRHRAATTILFVILIAKGITEYIEIETLL